MENANWEKRTCDIEKLSALPVGGELVGRFSHVRERELTDQTTKELKNVPEYVLTRPEDGSKFAFLGDAGFTSEFQKADIQEGELMKIIKGEQVDLGGGKRVNAYEIYTAQ